MGETAMMGESEDWALEIAQDIQVGRFRRERNRGRGQRGRAVQSGTSHASAGQEVSDRFQGIFLTHARDHFRGTSKVKALGTMEISAGTVPNNSPSAST